MPRSEKTYTVDYAFDVCGYKWIVFKNLTASIREKYQACENKQAAEKLADRLNEGE